MDVYCLVLICIVVGTSLGVHGKDVYCGNKPADVVFMLDSSNSIWGPDFQRQLQFVKDVVSMFQIGQNYTRVGIATFSSEPYVEFFLDHFYDLDYMLSAIGRIKERTGFATNTAAAITFMRKRMFSEVHGARENVARVGIVITDGQSDSILQTMLAAVRAQKKDIHMFAIGVGRKTKTRELQGIASRPSSNYMFEVDGYAALDSIKQILAIKTCQVTNRPAAPAMLPPATTTTAAMKVRTTAVPTTAVPTTPSTTITTTTKSTLTTTTPSLNSTTTSWRRAVKLACFEKPADIVFALDSSSKVSDEDFGNQIIFVRDFAQGVDLGPTKTRIGVVVFSDQVQRGFDLDDYYDVRELTRALYGIKRTAGSTRADEALRYITTKSFRRSVSRRNTAQIAVVLLGSESSDMGHIKKFARQARSAGLTLFAVGAGPDVNEEELQIIVGKGSEERSFRLDSFDDLQTTLKALALQACAVKETTLPVADQPCGARQEADVMFVLDSNNAGKTNTQKAKNFIRSLTSAMDVDKEKIQVGLMEPDPDCQPQAQILPLSSQLNHSELAMALEEKRSGDFHELLKDLRKRAFSERRGGRKAAKKIAILLVDGDLEDPLRALKEARFARIHGVEVYVIAVGSNRPQDELLMMCDTPTQQHFFHATNYDELRNLEDRILDIVCDEL